MVTASVYGSPTAKVRTAKSPGIFSNPGYGESYFLNTKDFYTNPTASNQYYGQNSSYFNQPGITENLFNANQGAFLNPSWGENQARNLSGKMVTPGVGQNFVGGALGSSLNKMGAGNQAQQAWGQFNKPVLSNDPGLAAYYENAKRRAAESIGQNNASRGTYGSSTAADQNAEAITNLEAERANREAEYNLSRLAEQRQWEGLGGQLAGQAAASQLGWTQGLGNLGLASEGLGLSGMQAATGAGLEAGQLGLSRLLGGMGVAQGIDQGTLAKILGGGTLAGQSDTADLARLLGGQQAATGAQDLMAGRGTNQYNQLLNLLLPALSTVGGGYEGLFTSDQGLADASTAAALGGGAENIRGTAAAGVASQEGTANLLNFLSLLGV